MKPVVERAINGGTQEIYRFDNNLGASVVSHQYSYGGDRGLFELAVIGFLSPDNLGFEILYDSSITDDVEGHLTRGAVTKLLKQIKALPLRDYKAIEQAHTERKERTARVLASFKESRNAD